MSKILGMADSPGLFGNEGRRLRERDRRGGGGRWMRVVEEE